MRVIEILTKRINEEIEDVETYARLAAEYKDSFPAMSHALYTISTQEENHVEMLHSEVVKVIDQYRKEHGAPPVAMQAVYDHLHKKAIEELAEAKNFQEIYKRM